MNRFTKNFNIPYYDGDKNGNIRAENILKYFGETSSEETEKIVEENEIEFTFGWMLYRWKVEIIKYPKVKEDVYVKTWVSKLDRFYAFREFTMVDKDDNVLVKASTVWICVDMDKKRPIRIPNNYSDMMDELGQPNFKSFHDFKDDLDIDAFIDFTVRRSDIDYNNHVNNTHYLSWIIESITEDIYNDYELRSFEIIYKKEIKYGDTISTGYVLESRDSGVLEFNHFISDFDREEEHAFGKTIWTKRN